MKIPPSITITPEILTLISHIDALRISVSAEKVHSTIKAKLTQTSLLKSSLYSARIEGATETLHELDASDDTQSHVFFILDAISYIDTHIHKGTKITRELLLDLHSIVMYCTRGKTKQFRTEQNAIFNTGGVAVYMPPPPQEVAVYIHMLMLYLAEEDGQFPLVKALLAHLVFEKIHPFIDGNGRVGRLLIHAVLSSYGYHFGIHLPLSEYLENTRNEYYHQLEQGLRRPDEYLLYMLTAVKGQLEKLRQDIHEESAKHTDTPLLPPRQEEIYHLIREHTMLSFDMLRRRFLKVPERTLRYDLKKMVDGGVIAKIGQTKGVWYRVK